MDISGQVQNTTPKPKEAKDKSRVSIRPYHPGDIDFICKAIKQELPKLPNYKNITVAPDRLSYLLRHNYGSSSNFQAWVLVSEETNEIVGGGAGYCVPGMVTWDLIANDVFLFVFEEWRTLRNCLMIMTAYKQWALARGAKMIMASQTGGYRVEAMNDIMRRQGYVECGFQWMLRLDENAPNQT